MLINMRNGLMAGGGNKEEEMFKEMYEGLVQRSIVDASQGNEDVTTIGDYAFYNASLLESASFPNVTTIGGYAFYNASLLESASFPNVTTIGGYAFYNTPKLSEVSFPNVVTIGGYAFWYSTFSHFVAPKVTNIGSQAFKYSHIQVVDFPLLTALGGTACFQGCYYLKTVNLPSLAELPSMTFYGCSAMTRFSAPILSRFKAGNAFDGNRLLQVIDISGGSAVAVLENTNVMAGVPATCKIVVPDALVNDYKADAMWSNYSDRIIGRTDAVSQGVIAA